MYMPLAWGLIMKMFSLKGIPHDIFLLLFFLKVFVAWVGSVHIRHQTSESDIKLRRAIVIHHSASPYFSFLISFREQDLQIYYIENTCAWDRG